MKTRNIIIGAVVCVLVGLTIGYVFFSSSQPVVKGVSTAGTYMTVINWSSITFTPNGGGASSLQTSTGTSTSILNSGATDRAIIGTYAECTQVQAASTLVANLILQVATTSTANNGLQGNTNYAAVLNIGTSTTGYGYGATTTEGALSYQSRIWPVNTYLTFLMSNATTTGNCTVGSEWFPL
jgi:hypothetical protein